MIESKPLMTAQEIRDEISRLIQKGSKAPVRIVVPFPVRLTQIDSSECNWTMGPFASAQGYEKIVNRAVEMVQRRWDLK